MYGGFSMSEVFVLEKSIIEGSQDENQNVIQEKFSKVQPRKNKSKEDFKSKECKVISYNKHTNTLDVNFDGFGIRLNDVKNFVGNTAIIKYKGEIGKPDFKYKL